MKIHIFSSEYACGSNMYVLESEGEYAVIDPSASFSKVNTALAISASQYRYIILTHSHFDHILYADEWVREINLPITVSEKDAPALSDANLNCYRLFFGQHKGYYGSYITVKEGDKLSFGDSFLEIIEAPGHTPGSIVIKFKNSLFVGDTVFAGGGIGRTDLPGGNYFELENSIGKILNFVNNTDVYPGHGPKTTIMKLKYD